MDETHDSSSSQMNPSLKELLLQEQNEEILELKKTISDKRKQEEDLQIAEQDKEIAGLKRELLESSVKVGKLFNETCAFKLGISELERLHKVVDDEMESKAVENIEYIIAKSNRLVLTLEAVTKDISSFVSSLKLFKPVVAAKVRTSDVELHNEMDSLQVADDDPTAPSFEKLQVQGVASVGSHLEVAGYPTNGTTTCFVQWFRQSSRNEPRIRIKGATSTDDIDMFIGIEVIPRDDIRMGKLIRIHMDRPIICGFSSSPAEVCSILSVRKVALFEHIQAGSGAGNGLGKKLSATTIVFIPIGKADQFSITGSDGKNRLLKVDSSEDKTRSRDAIVLTLRLFISEANNG